MPLGHIASLIGNAKLWHKHSIVCLSAYRKTHMETWILSENIFFSWFSFLIVLQVLHIFLCKNKSPLRPLSHFSGLSSIESIIDHTVSLSEISLVFFIYLTWRYNFFIKIPPLSLYFLLTSRSTHNLYSILPLHQKMSSHLYYRYLFLS